MSRLRSNESRSNLNKWVEEEAGVGVMMLQVQGVMIEGEEHQGVEMLQEAGTIPEGDLRGIICDGYYINKMAQIEEEFDFD